MILDFINDNYKITTDSVFLINTESPILTNEQKNYLILIEKPININIYVDIKQQDFYANLNKYFLFQQILNNPNKTILYLTDHHYYCNEFGDLQQNLSRFKVKRIIGDLTNYKFNNGCVLYTTKSDFNIKYDLVISDKVSTRIDYEIISEHKIILNDDVDSISLF